MPSGISNEVKTNRLDKKINFGVSRTASADTLPPESEAESSPITLPGHTIWKNSNNITATPPGTNTADIQVYKYVSGGTTGTGVGETNGVVELFPMPATEETPYNSSGEDNAYTGSINDITYYTAVNAGATTSPKSFVATSVQSGNITQRLAGRIDKWIPFGLFGTQYKLKIAVASAGLHGNSDLSGATLYQEIQPGTAYAEWYFDTDSGVLTFPNGLPKYYMDNYAASSTSTSAQVSIYLEVG